MRAIVFIYVWMFVLVSSSPVLAAKGGEKGPAKQAYERANENASFKRDENWKEDRGVKERKAKKKKEHKKAEAKPKVKAPKEIGERLDKDEKGQP